MLWVFTPLPELSKIGAYCVLEHSVHPFLFCWLLPCWRMFCRYPPGDPAIIQCHWRAKTFQLRVVYSYLLRAYLYFKGSCNIIHFYIPLIIFWLWRYSLIFLGQENQGSKDARQTHPSRKLAYLHTRWRLSKNAGAEFMQKRWPSDGVSGGDSHVLNPLYAVSHKSPTYGCNSCHNITMGTGWGCHHQHSGQGNEPTLKDNTFMVEPGSIHKLSGRKASRAVAAGYGGLTDKITYGCAYFQLIYIIEESGLILKRKKSFIAAYCWFNHCNSRLQWR